MTVTDVRDITSFKWATVTGVNPLAIRLDGDSAALALIPDSLIDPLNLGVGARVRVELSLRKCVIHGAANGGDGFDSGDIIATARATARTGWMLCQGQSLLRSAFPRLFAAIGTQYGAADSTHFNLPDARGRNLIGLDSTQAEFDVLGEKGGAKTHTLTQAQMPSHQHNHNQADGGNLSYSEAGLANQYVVSFGAGRANTGIMTGTTGGGQAHPILDPYIVMNYQIKL